LQASGCAGMQATCSTRMNNRIRSLAKSFACAASGMKYCVLCERNFRIHLVATAYVLALALLIDVDGTDFAILLLTAGAVIVMEMVNTAVEAVVDLASPQVHPLARVAKDVAAGAVLVAASVSVGIGCSLLWRPAKLLLLAKAALAAPPALAAFVLSAAFSVWFIFYSGQRKDAGTKESGSSK
jgi:diacylglycerol kinase